jgi:hypothetical protein
LSIYCEGRPSFCLSVPFCSSKTIPVFIAPLLRRDGDQRQRLLSAGIHHREEEHYGVQRTFGSQVAAVVRNQ